MCNQQSLGNVSLRVELELDGYNADNWMSHPIVVHGLSCDDDIEALAYAHAIHDVMCDMSFAESVKDRWTEHVQQEFAKGNIYDSLTLLQFIARFYPHEIAFDLITGPGW
jgi:hypothetical protein